MSKREMILNTIAIEACGVLTVVVTGDATAFVLLTAFACAPWVTKCIENNKEKKANENGKENQLKAHRAERK